MDRGPGTPPLSEQKPLTRLRDRIVILVAMGVVLISVVWALQDPPASRQRIDETATKVLTPETVSLVTGYDPLVEIFTRP